MKTKKQVNIFAIALYALAVVLINCVVNPLYSHFSADILTKYTLLPDIFEILKTVLDFLIYSLIMSVIIYSNYSFTKPKNIALLLICAGGIVARRLASFILDVIASGFSFSFVNSSIISSIATILLIETAQIVIVYFVSSKLIRDQLYDRTMKQKAARTTGAEFSFEPLTKFNRLIDTSNSIMSSALVAAATITLPSIFGRIVYDVIIGRVMNVENLISMIASYSMDVLSFFAAYFIIIFAVSFYADKGTKKEIE